MAKKPDKFGSPFDPRNRGKIERPKEDPPKFSLFGCGDPDCPACNPDTVGRGLPKPADTRRAPDGRLNRDNEAVASTADSNAVRAALLREAERRGLIRPGEFSGYHRYASARDLSWLEPPRNRDTQGPPASYKEARKEVEDWIVPAPDQAFDDIVGNAEALQQLRDAIEAPVKHAELYKAYNMKMPRGALLSGPPGCGKTMFARAAASEMKRLYGKAVEFISISGSELQQPYVGVTEQYIKAIFTYAREYKAYHGHPLLVFMDEAEVILPDRTGRIRKVAPWEESQVATFLAEMDGMQESGAFMLLATNRPEVIDQAVLRDGRCDFKIVVERPTQEAVEVILKKNFAGILNAEPTIDALVFAALESLYDPHKVILEAHAIKIDWIEEKVDFKDRHFLLEHIISGAMAASIPSRAKRFAFARDKETGVAKGVTTLDVVRAVDTLFQENKALDHSFALRTFQQQFLDELNAAERAKSAKGNKGVH